MTELPFTIENCQVGKLVKHYYRRRFSNPEKRNKIEINITSDLGLIIAIDKNIVTVRWFGFFPYNFNKNTISCYYIKDIFIYNFNYITVIQ